MLARWIPFDKLGVECAGLLLLAEHLEAAGRLEGGLRLPGVEGRRSVLLAKPIGRLEERLDRLLVIPLLEEHLSLHESGAGGEFRPRALGEAAVAGERLVEPAQVLPGPGGGVAGF